MQKLLDSWRTRKLTLMGKIRIMKTLAIPKIVYSASMLPIPTDLVKQLNKILYRFLWGNTDKIKRLTIINTCQNGGLNMIDINSHFMALKAAWLGRIYKESNNVWQILPRMYIDEITCAQILNMNVECTE